MRKHIINRIVQVKFLNANTVTVLAKSCRCKKLDVCQQREYKLSVKMPFVKIVNYFLSDWMNEFSFIFNSVEVSIYILSMFFGVIYLYS